MQPSCNLRDTDGASPMRGPPSLSSGANNPDASRFSPSLDRLWPKAVALKRPFLVIAFVLLILCTTSVSQTVIRPGTGTLIKDIARNGHGLLTIHNNWTMDTVAMLTDDNLKPLMAVYIRSKDSYKIDKINDGSYNLYFTVGNQWDTEGKKFQSVLGYFRYSTPLVFNTNENDTAIDYSIFELNLYEADASNFVPDSFEFPDLR